MPTMIEYNGVSHSLKEWESIVGIHRQTIRVRLGLGWSVEAALGFEDSGTKKLYEFNGVSHTASEWSRICGIKVSTLLHRIRRGWPIEDALNPNAKHHFKPRGQGKKTRLRGELAIAQHELVLAVIKKHPGIDSNRLALILDIPLRSAMGLTTFLVKQCKIEFIGASDAKMFFIKGQKPSEAEDGELPVRRFFMDQSEWCKPRVQT